MLAIAGVVFVFVMVFGGYSLSGGKFSVILYSLPYEMMMIGGAATGAFMISNSGYYAKKTLGDLKKVFSGTKWKKDDYIELLSLMFTITKVAKTKGMLALESHIENPHESAIFLKYERIMADHFAIDFICDTLRMMSMNLEDPHQVEDVMEKQLEKHHHEAMVPATGMQALADGTPALGIVAAVLGVIKTMSSINEPPEVLGRLIGGALVGTFLGVFLAYGFFGPMAGRLNQVYEEDHLFYCIIRDILVAHLHGNSAQISVEIGRGNVPSEVQPSFFELDNHLANLAIDA